MGDDLPVNFNKSLVLSPNDEIVRLCLKGSPLPPVDDYFPVFVTEAANPFNIQVSNSEINFFRNSKIYQLIL